MEVVVVNIADARDVPDPLADPREALLLRMIESGVLRTERIIHAFRMVDRRDFVPEPLGAEAYVDSPLPIGQGQTISQPSTVAFMLELLQPERGQKVLDVGSGSGWTTALLGAIVDHDGIVIGLEVLPELVQMGQRNLAKYPLPQASVRYAKTLGLPEEGPYDRILVSAAGTRIPQALIDQLDAGGVLVVPVKDSLWRITKINSEKIVKEEFPGFAFVPLRE